MNLSLARHVDISTDYSGGAGSQYASYSAPGFDVRHFPDRTKGGAINAALSLLDVPEEDGMDLFDVLGLSRFRDFTFLEPTAHEDL